MLGCKKEFTNRNIDQLKANMSQKEVESILGNPDRTEKTDLALENRKRLWQSPGTITTRADRPSCFTSRMAAWPVPPEKLKEN